MFFCPFCLIGRGLGGEKGDGDMQLHGDTMCCLRFKKAFWDLVSRSYAMSTC